MISIFPAQLSDAPAIIALEKLVHGEDVTSQYDMALAIHFGYVYVGKKDHKIIGAITAWQTRHGEVKVIDWVVHPEHRRRGIGERLYRHLLQEVKGKEVLGLVDSKNAASMNAHAKLGFVQEKKLNDPYFIQDNSKHWLWRRRRE
jgi:ribosomal protein S18 acetylase RimI-like enzyme